MSVFSILYSVSLEFLYCRPQDTFFETIYFWFSLSFIIGRTFMVALTASQINDESKRPAKVLRSIPNDAYNSEVSLMVYRIWLLLILLIGFFTQLVFVWLVSIHFYSFRRQIVFWSKWPIPKSVWLGCDSSILHAHSCYRLVDENDPLVTLLVFIRIFSKIFFRFHLLPFRLLEQLSLMNLY